MTSPRVARLAKVLLAACIIWLIAAKVPSFFFRLSLQNVDQNPSEPVPHQGIQEESDLLPPKLQFEHPNEDTKTPAKPTPEHHYREDGFVEVNPEASHPIFELIQRAEREWNEKIHRASTSLDEAVREYRRRYNRNPPLGFDKWWEYVKLNDVQLPDEYDQIYRDLEPFWGISPTDLNEIQKELEAKQDSYTLGKSSEKDTIAVLTYAFQEGRYDQLIKGSEAIIDLLKQVSDQLPPFRATFSPHDAPNRLSDYEIRDAAVEAAAHSQLLSRKSLPKPSTLGWLSACPPTSRARLLPDMFIQQHNGQLQLDEHAPPTIDSPKYGYQSESFRYPDMPGDIPRTKSFIYNHPRTMDPCNNPALFWTHGQFLSHHQGPGPQPYMVPEFSACTTTLHHNIHIPTPYGWVEDLLEWDNPLWDEREDERLMWRGSNTGIWHGRGMRWKGSHRDWLITWANGISGTVDVLFGGENDTVPVGTPKPMRRARLNPAMIDMGFAGEMQCDPEACTVMEEIYPWKKRMSPKESGHYKYVMDVDGNGWSGRFKRLITSHALVFKATIYPEWYTERVQPWVHYVPVQVDLSDLYDVLIFFRGDPNGQGAHEELAKKIASQGRDWSKTFWRKEDLVAYFYRLILEYARVMSPDREKMTYNGDGHESWDWKGRD